MLHSDLKDPVRVETQSTLQSMVNKLEKERLFAVDTESNSLFVYREQVCLIQISTNEDDYLVDPLAIKDLSSLGPLFANPEIEKVFHAGEYDLICLKRDYGFTFSNLFDTMIAGRILGREVFGLSAMLEAEFEISLDKHWQRANWGIRPMPAAQLAYARMDSHFLIPLRERLLKELIETDRLELAQEDFSRLERTAIPQGNGDKEIFWKLSGKQDFTTQQLSVLHRLCKYREEQAKKANLPPFKILSNETLVALAQISPKTVEELENITGLPEKLRLRHAEGILNCVAQAQHSPPPRKPVHARKDDSLIQRLDVLKTWRKKTAAEWKVESDVVLPREVVEDIAFKNPQSGDDLSAIMCHFPWRLQRFGDEILQVIHPEETV
jgi:ribonuclease D